MQTYYKKLLVTAFLVIVAAHTANAALSFTGSQLSQNFDSLPTSASAWTNDSTLPGWSLFRQPTPGTAITSLGADNGSSNTGSFYSYGSTGSTDRALGSLGSGGTYFGSPASNAIAGWTAVAITNNAGADASSFTVMYDGEEWRNGGNTSAQTMVLEYGFGSSFTSVSSWSDPGGTFDFTSPTVGATATALDGNDSANRASDLGGIITTDWAAGSTLWIRWVERNDPGNDHGLALDNFSFSAAVPEPTSLGMSAVVLIGAAMRRRSRAGNHL